MPIFARRRLQAMLRELGCLLSDGKAADLIARLESKRVDQALPAEMELALLWGLSRLGDLEVEPDWIGSGRLPDAFSECLFPGRLAFIEIAAVSDGSLSGEEEMRRASQVIGEYASHVKRGSGSHLYFRFSEESGYQDGRYFRRRTVARDFRLDTQAKEALRFWLTGEQRRDQDTLRIATKNIDVTIEWRDRKPHRLFNFFSSMPPEAHSVTENPLATTLRLKDEQLRGTPENSVRCVMLADAGSTLLRRIEARDPMRRYYSGGDVIQWFLDQEAEAVDALIVFSPFRPQYRVFQSHSERQLVWKVTHFSKRGLQLDYDGVERLASFLPRPRFEGYQARSLQQQRLFSPGARGWYLGTKMMSSPTATTITISARALVDLLAGRITHEQFAAATGLTVEANLFANLLRNGKTIANIRFDPGGIDVDDDRIVFELDFDVAAGPLNRG